MLLAKEGELAERAHFTLVSAADDDMIDIRSSLEEIAPFTGTPCGYSGDPAGPPLIWRKHTASPVRFPARSDIRSAVSELCGLQPALCWRRTRAGARPTAVIRLALGCGAAAYG